jgi:hypothetical protein
MRNINKLCEENAELLVLNRWYVGPAVTVVLEGLMFVYFSNVIDTELIWRL